MDTVSKGETVVRVPGSSETHHLSGIASSPGETLPADELAEKLRDTAVSAAAEQPHNKLVERRQLSAVGYLAACGGCACCGSLQAVTRHVAVVSLVEVPGL